MKQKLLFLFALVTLLTWTPPSSAFGQCVGDLTSSPTVLQFSMATESTDGRLNYKNFEFTVPTAGDYYASAWILPSMFTAGSYTSFSVYLNYEYIGMVTPKHGNWQSASLSDKPLRISAGTNVISIATQIPEFPSVESIKVAAYEAEAVFSTDAYEEFIEESFVADTDYYAGDEDFESSPLKISNEGEFYTVPLLYTFYKIFTFKKGEEVVIKTSSSTVHNIDLFYYSPAILSMYDSQDSLVDDCKGASDKSSQIKIYTRPSDDEMQGLNWMAPSSTSSYALDLKYATLRMTVPQTGLYFMRVRSARNSSGLVNVNVNDKYTYNLMSIRFTNINVSLPADGKKYAVIASGRNQDDDDPMIFIHGNDADRVVGFNDDGTSSNLENNNLSKWDSFLSQSYHVRTNMISVGNYSSSNPKSTCTVSIYPVDKSIKASPGSKIADKPDDGSRISIGDGGLYVSKSIELGGSLIVESTTNIDRLAVHNLSGSNLGSASGLGTKICQPVDALGIHQRGIYIIYIESAGEVYSTKISVL